jgi:uncharacterized protein (DUF433 family)
MTLDVELPPFLAYTCPGELDVAGTRVSLYHLITHYTSGESAELLAVRYPQIPLATAHKVIAFYLENQPAVDRFVTEYAAALDRNRQGLKPLDRSELLARLAARQPAKAG